MQLSLWDWRTHPSVSIQGEIMRPQIFGHIQCSLLWSLRRSHAIRYSISIQAVFAADFFLFCKKSKRTPDKPSLFWKKKKASLQTPLFLFSWIRPSQLRSINTTEPAAPAAEWGLSAVGSVQWKRPAANGCYVSLLRVDSLVDQEHLGQSRIY